MPEPSSEAWAHIRYDYEHTDRPVEDICAEHGFSSGTLRDRVRRWGWTRRRAPISRDGPPPVPMAQREIATANLWPLGPRALLRQSEAALASRRRVRGDERENPAPPSEIAAYATAVPIVPSSEGETSEGARTESGEEAPHAQAGEKTGAPAESGPASIVQRLQGATARVLPAIEAIIARLAAGPQHPREMEQAGRALSSLTRTLRELNALLSQHNAQAANAYDDMPEDMDAFREHLARRIRTFVASRRGDGDKAKAEET